MRKVTKWNLTAEREPKATINNIINYMQELEDRPDVDMVSDVLDEEEYLVEFIKKSEAWMVFLSKLGVEADREQVEIALRHVNLKDDSGVSPRQISKLIEILAKNTAEIEDSDLKAVLEKIAEG